MSRGELMAVTAAALFAAVCLGWLAAWVAGRIPRSSGADLSAMDRLAQSLHEAEEARDEAGARAERAEAERDLALTELEEVRTEADALSAHIERARAGG
jgi:hypothetical protein